jgi:integrase/recombinase XerD
LILEKEVEMTHICSSIDRVSISSFESSSVLPERAHSSFLVSPRFPDQRDSLANSLARAFGHKSGFFHRVITLEVPDKVYVQLHLLHMHRRNFRLLTITQAFGTLTGFLKWLNTTRKSRVQDVTRRDLEAFVEHLQDREQKLSAVRTVLARIYAFLSFMIEQEAIPAEVLMQKIKLRLPEYLPRAMDPYEVRRLLSVIQDTRDRAIVLLLLRTGMRIGELLNTRLRDVNLQERKIIIVEGRKNRRGRVVYFSDDARDALNGWLKHRDSPKPFLFHSRGRNTFSYSSGHMMFKKYLRAAGLIPKGYSLHSLRHTFASELLNAGMRLECLQQLLGHDSIEITRRYARLTDKTREEEYFRAMAIIERGEIDGTYRVDSQLQAILKEKEQLATYGNKLSGKPSAVHPLAGRTP